MFFRMFSIFAVWLNLVVILRICVCSQIGAYDSHHRRGFLWHLIGANADIPRQILGRKKAQIRDFHQVPPFGALGSPWKQGGKVAGVRVVKGTKRTQYTTINYEWGTKRTQQTVVK